MNEKLVSRVRSSFNSYSSESPIIVRSPGRINFIGEHTDYNDGFVLPAAIDKAIYMAGAKSGDRKIKLVSLDLNDSIELNLNDIVKTEKQWVNYLAGTVAEIQKFGVDMGGFTFVFGGDIPIGAGLSSSAAICCGMAFSLNELFSLGLNKKQLAFAAQKAEHNYAGVNCGIMDQFINLHAEKNTALKLDCRSLEFKLYPFNYPEISVILCDSGVKHELASSEYNLRRTQCEKGSEEIRKVYPQVKNLRDVSLDMLEEFEDSLPQEIYTKCLFVVEENERVNEACECLDQDDLAGFASLLPLTHEGLRIDYEVSIPEMDELVYAALDIPGVYGSRMMGGGFGGCTLNIVDNGNSEHFQRKMKDYYYRKFGHEPKTFECAIEGGTGII